MAHRHNPTLDGIRGLAIFAVLLTHSTDLFEVNHATGWLIYCMAAGWSGVDLFFVLSGFLITGILLDTKTAVNRVKSFYVRRILRIFPIYYLALFVAFVVAAWRPGLVSLSPLRSWQNRVFFLAYLQNWLEINNSGALLNSAVGHFWSLAVEEQFYLVWPWIVWVVPEKVLLRLSLAGIVSAFLLRLFLVAHFGPHVWIHTLTVTRGEGLLTGSALAILAFRRQRISPLILLSMAASGATLLMFIFLHDRIEFINTDSGPYVYTIGISGFGLLFGALVGSSSYHVPVLTPALNVKWLRALGKYSYGIYIYHVPLYFGVGAALKRIGLRYPLAVGYSLAVLVLQIGLSFVVAWLSYVLLENKFLSLKRYFEPASESPKFFPERPADLPA